MLNLTTEWEKHPHTLREMMVSMNIIFCEWKQHKKKKSV
jgi:hypothetical protein